MRKVETFDYENIQHVFSLLSKCTEDYLFIYDFPADEYAISARATETFMLEEPEFDHATEILMNVCHPEDRKLLRDNLQGIIDGTVREHNLEYRWLGRNGHSIWISCRGQVVYDQNDHAKYMVGRITELGRRNMIDNTTGLYREIRLKSDLTKRVLTGDKNGFLLRIGIDNFKTVNDKFGRNFGDSVLNSVAECIRECVDEHGRVYRMDGDEMMVMAEVADYDQKEDQARTLYHKIRQRVDESIAAMGYKHFHTISAGGTYFKPRMQDANTLLEQAEFALHEAKQRGKNTYVRYQEETYQAFVKRMDIQERLRRSVEENYKGFELYYQPIVNTRKKKILGAEALLRWQDDVVGRLSPAEFVPLLEESGLIIPVGRWVIRTALEQCLCWQKKDKNFRMNINLSSIQLKKSDVIMDIETIMQELGIGNHNVLFEVTESGELESDSITQKILFSFRKRNLNLGIDDFGTGYSNFRYVKEMMFDLVKIDQAFIRNITKSQYDYLVVKQMTELAHSLNLKVCYEGVETADDLECVLDLNPDYIQRYYFAKPTTASDFETCYLCMEQKF